MKNLKITKSLSSFADSSINMAAMKQVVGGGKLCRDAQGTVYPCGQLH